MRIIEWLKESNRWKHLILAIPVGFVFTLLAVLGCASGMEFKDRQWGGRWSWADWLCTMIGGVIGQALQCVAVWLLV